MADIFREVRERLDMDTVARHYGYQPNRAGFIHCPFHPGDRTASLKLYPGSRGWHCFGCNRGGSVIDFVALDLGLAPLDAVRRLNEDFSLGLPVDRPATAADRKAAAHRKAVSSTYQDFSAWRDSLCTRLNACFRVAHTALLSLEAPEEPLLERIEAEALAARVPIIRKETQSFLKTLLVLKKPRKVLRWALQWAFPHF